MASEMVLSVVAIPATRRAPMGFEPRAKWLQGTRVRVWGAARVLRAAARPLQLLNPSASQRKAKASALRASLANPMRGHRSQGGPVIGRCINPSSNNK